MQNQVNNPAPRRRTIADFFKTGWNNFCNFFKRLSCCARPVAVNDIQQPAESNSQEPNNTEQIDQVQNQNFIFAEPNQPETLSKTVTDQFKNQPELKRPKSAMKFKSESIVNQQQSVFKPASSPKQQNKAEFSDNSQPDVDLLNVSKKSKNSESDLNFTKQDLGSFVQSEPHSSNKQTTEVNPSQDLSKNVVDQAQPQQTTEVNPFQNVGKKTLDKFGHDTSEVNKSVYIKTDNPQQNAEVNPFQNLSQTVLNELNSKPVNACVYIKTGDEQQVTLKDDNVLAPQQNTVDTQIQQQNSSEIYKTAIHQVTDEQQPTPKNNPNNGFMVTSSMVAKRNEANSPALKSSVFIHEDDKKDNSFSDFEDLSIHENVVEQPTQQTVEHCPPSKQEAIKDEDLVATNLDIEKTTYQNKPEQNKNEIAIDLQLDELYKQVIQPEHTADHNKDFNKTIIAPPNSRSSTASNQKLPQMKTPTVKNVSNKHRYLKPIRSQQNNEQANQM